MYSNYKHVQYLKGGRLKETSRYAIAKLESIIIIIIIIIIIVISYMLSDGL